MVNGQKKEQPFRILGIGRHHSLQHGDMLRAAHTVSLTKAERHFSDALDLAFQQKALAWQLRAASSLARLRRTQDRTSEGRDLLASVYNTFTEGYDLHDLVVARSLLNELA
jgi:hypothetical protein